MGNKVWIPTATALLLVLTAGPATAVPSLLGTGDVVQAVTGTVTGTVERTVDGAERTLLDEVLVTNLTAQALLELVDVLDRTLLAIQGEEPLEEGVVTLADGTRVWLNATLIRITQLVTGGQATATAQPAIVGPGEPVDLALRLEGSLLPGPGLGGTVACTVTHPDGTTDAPCVPGAGTEDVDLLAGRFVYNVTYTAPDEPGAYLVTFWTQDADGDAVNAIALTSFQVQAPAAGPGPAGQGGGGDGGTDGEAGDGAPGDPGAGDGDGTDEEDLGQAGAGDGAGGDGASEGGGLDLTPADRSAARLLVSMAMATAVLALTLVTRRWPLGGT